MIYSIIIIFMIVGLKAIFSAADTAFTFLNRAEINQLSKKDKKSEKIKILMEDTNKFFGVIEVGLNMAELLASAVTSITILEYLIDFFEEMQLDTNIAALISVAIITLILAYIMLVFGTILPKRVARNNPKKVAYKLIPTLWIISKINHPFERLIDITTNFFSKILNIKQEPEERLTEKQLKMIIREAKDEGVLESIENRIMLNTLRANDISVKKVMLPFDKAFTINIQEDFLEIINKIKENNYTRIPVYNENKSNILGIFYLKDVAIEGIHSKEQIEKSLRKPLYIDANEKIFTTFTTLQKNNQMIGIITDNNNQPIGLITMEDIVEKLVGKIFDEDDKKNL